MNRMPHPLAIAITSALTIGLSGCFSSSSSSSNADEENTQSGLSGLSGTAATGAPLVGAEVCLRAGNADSSAACTLSTSTDDDGQYQFSDDELADLERPFHISVRGDSAAGNPVTLSSAASGDSQTTSNITPLTEALLYAASDGENGLEIAASQLADLDLPNAQQGLRSVLANALSRLGIDANVDFIEDDDFAADRTGVDLMLDLVEIDQYDLEGDGSPRIQLTERGNRSNRIVLKWDNAGIEIDEDNSTPESEFLEHSMDLTDIDGFYDELLVVMGSGDAGATDELLHEDALDYGETREDLRDLISDDNGFFSGADSFGTVNVSGCSTADICNAGVRVFDEHGDEFYTLQLDLKRTNGDWRLYGNQRDHDFKLQPYAERFIDLSEEEPEIEQVTGMQLLLNPSDHMNEEVHTAVISAKRGEDKVALYTLSDCEDGTEDWLCLQNEEGDKAGGNMIYMNTEEAAAMATDDGNYILALKDEQDDPIATYADLGLKTAPFRGNPDAYDNNYASLSDDSIDALKAVDSTTETLELSWEIKDGLRVDELIIDFHTVSNGIERLVDTRYRSFEDGEVIDFESFEEDVTGFASLRLISRDSLGRTYFSQYLP